MEVNRDAGYTLGQKFRFFVQLMTEKCYNVYNYNYYIIMICLIFNTSDCVVQYFFLKLHFVPYKSFTEPHSFVIFFK
jgi:hypothetical protein